MLSKAQLQERQKQIFKKLSRLEQEYDTAEPEDLLVITEQIDRLMLEFDNIEEKLESLM
jgi:hypothetical protein